jgi:DNA-binding IclR family transcriptional regulator
MLSCLEEYEVKRMMQKQTFKAYTPHTVKNLDHLLSDLLAIRKRGFSIDNEEIEIGLRCVGAPIQDHTGRMIGARSVAAPSARLTNQKILSFGRLVAEVAADISKELGYERQKGANAR